MKSEELIQEFLLNNNVKINVIDYIQLVDDVKTPSRLVDTIIIEQIIVDSYNGFSESVVSKKNKKKIPFFYLGPKNNWKKILKTKISNKIEISFEKEMKKLGYL